MQIIRRAKRIDAGNETKRNENARMGCRLNGLIYRSMKEKLTSEWDERSGLINRDYSSA